MESFIALMGFLYIIFLICEKTYYRKIRSKFKHVIHVNGTRGKSTVSRLIDAGLREAGFSVLTKTTGTSPRIIHPDGHESEIKRKHKANIREQLRTMKLAASEQAEILVIECMAVKPELQLVSQRDMLEADIGVITNARLDHQDEMGNSLYEITKSLSNTMPDNGVLFTADEKANAYYMELEQVKRTKVFLVNEVNIDFDGIDFEENVAIACHVCVYLGVDRNIALRGMKKYKADPGRLMTYQITNKNQAGIMFINALAVNDPDSTMKIYKIMGIENEHRDEHKILLINNRSDRAGRMIQYVDFSVSMSSCFDEFWIIGGMKGFMRKKLISNGISKDRIMLLKDMSPIDELQEDTLILGVGNIGGCGEGIVEFFQRDGEKYAG